MDWTHHPIGVSARSVTVDQAAARSVYVSTWSTWRSPPPLCRLAKAPLSTLIEIMPDEGGGGGSGRLMPPPHAQHACVASTPLLLA
tara:strand:- start:1320 stop:1577 length:258 start_codon:yes stop_codon:yes gene_type:complete